MAQLKQVWAEIFGGFMGNDGLLATVLKNLAKAIPGA